MFGTALPGVGQVRPSFTVRLGLQSLKAQPAGIKNGSFVRVMAPKHQAAHAVRPSAVTYMPLKTPLKPNAPHVGFPSSSASSAGIRGLPPPRAAMDSSSESDLEDDPTMRLPPTLPWRLLSALFYAVPWIDSVMLGYPMFGALPSFVPLYFAPAPLTKIFFCHPYAPLAIFFLMYLAVVRNQRLHHFVRFHCMQATMIDILAMMFMIAAAFFPAQFKASWLFEALNSFGFTTMMIFVLFSIVSALMGYYADIPLLSDSAYHQITIAEYAP